MHCLWYLSNVSYMRSVKLLENMTGNLAPNWDLVNWPQCLPKAHTFWVSHDPYIESTYQKETIYLMLKSMKLWQNRAPVTVNTKGYLVIYKIRCSLSRSCTDGKVLLTSSHFQLLFLPNFTYEIFVNRPSDRPLHFWSRQNLTDQRKFAAERGWTITRTIGLAL